MTSFRLPAAPRHHHITTTYRDVRDVIVFAIVVQVGLSEGFEVDRRFARQLKKRFISA